MNVFDRWHMLIKETGLEEREDDKGMMSKHQQGFYKGILLATMNGIYTTYFEVYSLDTNTPKNERRYDKTNEFRSRRKVEEAIKIVKESMKQIDEDLANGFKIDNWYLLRK